MMILSWLEQPQSGVPADQNWLSGSERIRLNGFRIPKRRADWALGRWTAKNAAALFLDSSLTSKDLARIEIRPEASGAPQIYVSDRRPNFEISLSHASDTALCVLGSSEIIFGCDLEHVEPRSSAFIGDYFTPDEQHVIGCCSVAERPTATTLLWSAKESVLKALREGLRMDTRSVCVSLDSLLPFTSAQGVEPRQLGSPAKATWNTFTARFSDRAFLGWWRVENQLVRTIAYDGSRL